MVEKEEDKIEYLTIITYCMLAIVAIALGLATYLLTSREEESCFRNQFDAYTTEIVDVFNNEAVSVFGIFESLSVDAIVFFDNYIISLTN